MGVLFIMDIKKALKKFWHFVWEDDSLLSWIVNVVLAFVLIKYVIFPVMAFMLGSIVPVVAVVSSSMEHDGSFDNWWSSQAYCGAEICTQKQYYENIGITKEEFSDFEFKNGFNKGDVMILSSAENLELGDTIVYLAGNGKPIIHRIISLDPLETKGDNNVAQIFTQGLDESQVSKNPILGKASLRLPFIGYVKIAFANLLSLFGVQVS